MITKLCSWHTRTLCAFFIAFLLTGCIGGQTVQVAPPPQLEAPSSAPSPTNDGRFFEWFSLIPPAADNWIIEPVDANTLTLKLRDEAQLPGREPYRVAALFSKKSSAYDTAFRTMLGVLEGKRVPISFTLMHYANDEALGQEALETIRAEEFDLVLGMGSASVAFLHTHFRGDSIPVVTMTAKDPVLLGQVDDYEGGSGSNIAYTSLNMPLELQMRYLLEFRPNLKNILILYATDNTSAVETQVTPLRDLASEQAIALIDVAVVDRDNAASELAVKLPQAIAQLGADVKDDETIILITGSTSVFDEIATISANSGGIPVLSVVPDVVQAGTESALLSIGVGFQSNAHLATLYAIDILQGRAEVAELQVGIVSPPDIAINFGIARENNLTIPFSFFERATTVYDGAGVLVREDGRIVNVR